MKKHRKLGFLVLASAMVLTSCSADKGTKKEEVSLEEEYLERVSYSNIVDQETADLLYKEFDRVAIKPENEERFFTNVYYFIDSVGKDNLNQEGFKTIRPEENMEIPYDFVKILERWQEKNPYYIGNNCRMTSYDLLRDKIGLNKRAKVDDENLFMDLDAIESSVDSKTVEYDDDFIDGFKVFYGQVETEHTDNINTHLENLKKEWKKREIEFKNMKDLSMINVVFHSDLDEQDILFIGHSGVLIEREEGELLFIEKVSFDTPYQVLKFKNRSQLNDYLMGKYDLSYGQETAKPFIMENDDLMEGYRPNPNNIEEK